jgi:lipopolysaccharide biosynthesis protein
MKRVSSIFFHNYYGDHVKWLQLFINNFQIPFNLYYNIVNESIYNTDYNAAELQAFFERQTDGRFCNLIIRESSNKGKDIGGKLILLDTYYKLGEITKYGLFLHDKRSPYKANHKTWAENLLKTSEPSFILKSINRMDKYEQIGIVAAPGTLKNEFDPISKSFIGKNSILLEKLITKYCLFISNYDFVAGSMFWCRMQPLHLFFSKYSSLEIRKALETGNVMDEFGGTYTHCWERLLSWIISAEGYEIKVI